MGEDIHLRKRKRYWAIWRDILIKKQARDLKYQKLPYHDGKKRSKVGVKPIERK